MTGQERRYREDYREERNEQESVKELERELEIVHKDKNKLFTQEDFDSC